MATDEASPQTPREAADEARRQRLLTAISDMDEAALAARWLHATHLEVDEQPGFEDVRLRIVMETGMFVSYARPFTQSRGERNLPVAPTRGLTDEQRGVHEWALERRKKSAAHFDQDNEDRIVFTGKIVVHHPELGELVLEEGEGRLERYRPPAPDELLALAGLAEHLAARYRNEAFGP